MSNCTTPHVSPAVSLWPHQVRALEAIGQAVAAGRQSGLIVLPTGAGKTVMFTTFAREFGQPALVLVHRDELVRQTIATVGRVWPGSRVGVIQGERDEWRDGQDIVVASVQSLHAQRLETMPRDRFGVLVCDEAHHSAATTYQRIIKHFQVSFHLGVTATPKRLDGEGLADWYGEQPLFVYSIREAVRDGILVNIKQSQIVTGTDLDAVTTRGGDFAESELARAVNNLVRNKAIVAAYQQHATGRRAICFAVDLEHVAALTRVFQEAGVRAVSITGKDSIDCRRQTLADFAAGTYHVLVNCQVATEGFDDQGVSCILMGRPTQSQSLYIQCVGRGLRRCDETGKADCLVLDCTDNCKWLFRKISSSFLSISELCVLF